MNKDEEKEIKKPAKEISAGEQRIEFRKVMPAARQETKEEITKREALSEEERIIKEQLKKEIEMMELDANLIKEAEQKAKKIEFLGEKEKIEHLLEIAKERGIIFSVQVAKEMKDPYILDIFHDILAREGYYKKFTK
jgi:hypothetical protein